MTYVELSGSPFRHQDGGDLDVSVDHEVRKVKNKKGKTSLGSLPRTCPRLFPGFGGRSCYNIFRTCIRLHGAKIILGLTQFYLGEHGKPAFTADRIGSSRSPAPN
jgi:hypothetical protein